MDKNITKESQGKAYIAITKEMSVIREIASINQEVGIIDFSKR